MFSLSIWEHKIPTIPNVIHYQMDNQSQGSSVERSTNIHVTQVWAVIHQGKITPLQVRDMNVLLSVEVQNYYQQNVFKVSIVQVIINNQNEPLIRFINQPVVIF